MNHQRIKFVTQGAIIAALYVILTYLAALLGLANNPIQIRFSELLTLLPLYTPAAIPGLAVGCLLANILTGCIIWDVLFGTLATIIGAVGTYLIGRLLHGALRFWLAPLPPILSNIIIVPLVLTYAYGMEGGILYFMLTVGIGEVISCGVLGLLVFFALHRLGYDKLFLLQK